MKIHKDIHMSAIKIDEAIDLAKKNKRIVDITDIAKKIYPNATSVECQRTLFYRCRKESKGSLKISANAVKIICDVTGVDANFLFDIEPSDIIPSDCEIIIGDIINSEFAIAFNADNEDRCRKLIKIAKSVRLNTETIDQMKLKFNTKFCTNGK